MRSTLWRSVLALLLGAGAGLAYAWVLSPLPVTDAPPRALRADFKDQYRSLIAAAYAANGNLPRAQARLSLLGDASPVDALDAQAQRMRANSQTFERADYVAALALALRNGPGGAAVSTRTPEFVPGAGNTFTPTPALLTEVPLLPSETPLPDQTQPARRDPTPRPTATFTPTAGRPFLLTGQENVCDSNLPPGLLQVVVSNRNRRQLAGVEIVIAWEGGQERFFTGLKTELGSGYADFSMTRETAYTVQLARGSEVARDVTVPACQRSDGTAFPGGVRLTFQQP